jgi:hypothetical protein
MVLYEQWLNPLKNEENRIEQIITLFVNGPEDTTS